MGMGSVISGVLPTQGMQSAVERAQSTPQPMGGKGGTTPSTGNPYAPRGGEPNPPRQMGGKGLIGRVSDASMRPQYTRDFYTGFNRQQVAQPQPTEAPIQQPAPPTQSEPTPAVDNFPIRPEFDAMRQFPSGYNRFGGFAPIGGKGGGFNPFGGYGGAGYGYRPFYGQDYAPSAGLGSLAALMQGRGIFFNEGGEVK